MSAFGAQLQNASKSEAVRITRVFIRTSFASLTHDV
jgi:hypothetical protein